MDLKPGPKNASQRKSKKKGFHFRGQTRMDAALDAMRPFGFPDPLVRQKVKKLLNVYGGDEGWVFVEEGAYSLLIETLLDNENANEEERRHNSSQAEAGDADDDTNVPAGEPEPSTLLHACSNLVDADPVLQIHEVFDTSSRVSDPLYTASRTTSHLSHDEKDCLQTSSNTVGCENLEKTLDKSPSNDISSPLPEHSHPIRKRKFYHGWIDSNNDKDEYGDDDLVELAPAPVPEESTKLMNRVQKAQDKVGL